MEISSALLIGINNYENKEVPNLRYCNNDAEGLAKKIKELEVFSVPRDFIHVLITKGGESPTRKLIMDKLAEILRSAKRIQGILFYFAGHGI